MSGKEPTFSEVRVASNPAIRPREVELLGLMATGYNYRQAAKVMGVCRDYARRMGHEVQLKLGADNITHAVVMAMRNGLIK